MALPSLSAEDPRVLAMAATLVVAAAFGAALASGAIGVPGAGAQGGAGPAFTGNVTDAPTSTAETPPLTETPADGPENSTVTVTDDDGATDPAGDTPTGTGTETDTDVPSDPPTDGPVTDTPTDDPVTDTPTDDPVTDTPTDENQPPEALFVAASVPLRVGDEETFHASQSDDPDGDIVSYEWDFGDGGTATGETVNHTYDESRQYNVTLTVTDDDGATDSDTVRFTAAEPLTRPTASFSADPESADAGEEVEFSAESYDGEDPGGEIVTYEWEFGDGTEASGQNVTHTFDSGGTYNVTLEVMSSDMLSDTTSQQYTVGDGDSTAEAEICPPRQRVGDVGEPVEFRASGPDGEYESYEWEFAPIAVDGPNDPPTSATGHRVTNTFYRAGTYNVTLTVTDEAGLRDSQTREIGVYGPNTLQCPVPG